MRTFVGPFGICIVYFNRPDKLARLLQSIEQSDRKPSHIVVVDNNSQQPAQEVIETASLSEGIKVKVLQLSKNLGFATAFNSGCEELKRLHLKIWVNAAHDCVFTPTTLGALVDKAAEPMTLVGPTVVDFVTHEVFSSGGYVKTWLGKVDAHTEIQTCPTRVQWLDGSCFAIGQQLFEKIGGMDERFFLYFEDVDLGLRVVRAGGSVWVLPVITYQDPQGPSDYLRGHSSGVLARGHMSTVFGWSLIARNVAGVASSMAQGRWRDGVSRARGLSKGLTGARAAY